VLDRRGCAAIGADAVTSNIVDYGGRVKEFRGIIFRDGPTGRRAALSGGPDVWELMATLASGKARGEEAITATAELLNLTDFQVQTAVRYYGAFPGEIDRRIALNAADAR
jgi:hypothetical protein